MVIKVEVFGYLQDIIGTRVKLINVKSPKLSDLLDILTQAISKKSRQQIYKDIKEKKIIIVVNGKPVSDQSYKIPSEAEIVLMPPVSGG
jgi:MoaD family protein